MDDGYAFFSSVAIVKALQKFKIEHPRIVFFYETDEESGSKDLIYWLEREKDRVGVPDVLVCLDSGCVDYSHFCITTSLRGVL